MRSVNSRQTAADTSGVTPFQLLMILPRVYRPLQAPHDSKESAHQAYILRISLGDQFLYLTVSMWLTIFTHGVFPQCGWKGWHFRQSLPSAPIA